MLLWWSLLGLVTWYPSIYFSEYILFDGSVTVDFVYWYLQLGPFFICGWARSHLVAMAGDITDVTSSFIGCDVTQPSRGNRPYRPSLINSLGPSDAIWHWRSWSTLVQVMACCLTAPSHYLNRCWLIIISKVSEYIIIRRFEDTNR